MQHQHLYVKGYLYLPIPYHLQMDPQLDEMIEDGHKVWKREELMLDINTAMYRVVGQNAEVVELLQQSTLAHVLVLQLVAPISE
jgi:hypothetical protein